jgi:tetratricopeptide (TPR) repeat protein
MNFKNISIILFIICLASSLQSQSFKAYSNAAEEAFIGKDYYSALVFFNQALEFKKKRTDIMYKAAESARQINAYGQAETYFKTIAETDELNKYPLASLYLAEAQQKLGKYEMARNNFAVFIADNPDDTENVEIAQLGINACEWAQEIDSSSTTNVAAMGAHVNTPYSEFGASIFEDEVTFSSMRYKREQEELKLPDQLYSKILNSKEEGEASIIKTFDSEYDMTANSTFNKDRTKVYYTKCRYINNVDIRCQIYMRTIGADGTYGPEVSMPDFINLEGSTSTHPNVSFDTHEQAEYLYFVSDRSGGKGKMDVWRSKMSTDGNFERPTNVEFINTSANEITPSFHSPSQTLYFSTDGRIGMGGFDIFKTVKVKDSWAEIENIGPPVNSSLNDIYFVLGDDFSTGLLSSNRIGSMYLDPSNEACCYAVYQAEFITLELIATAYDNNTKEQLFADFKLIHDQSSFEEEEMNIEEHDG